MSFSFSAFFTSAESALASAFTVAKPIIALAEQAAPIVETFVPSSAPIIAGVEAGAASITAIAPTAVQDASALISAGRTAYADLGPSLASLETILSGLFHMNVIPGGQAIVLTPKTSAATAAVSIAPPGKAIS